MLHCGITVARPKVASLGWHKGGLLIKRKGLLATSHLSRKDAPTHCIPPLHRGVERRGGETEMIKDMTNTDSVIRQTDLMLKVKRAVKDAVRQNP